MAAMANELIWDTVINDTKFLHAAVVDRYQIEHPRMQIMLFLKCVTAYYKLQ